MDPHEPARGGHEFGSFAFDDVHVVGFGQQPVACLEVLLQFAFAHFAGGFGHLEGDLRITHTGGKNKSVAEEIITQQHCRLAAPTAMNSRDVAAGLGIVEDIVVNQRCCMHHFHGNGQIEATGGLATEHTGSKKG